MSRDEYCISLFQWGKLFDTISATPVQTSMPKQVTASNHRSNHRIEAEANMEQGGHGFTDGKLKRRRKQNSEYDLALRVWV